MLKIFKDDENTYRHKESLDTYEKNWRSSLLVEGSTGEFDRHHLYLIDESFNIDFKHELYFSRGVDIEIAESDTKCFIYSKFAKFIILSEITALPHQALRGTNLNQELLLDSDEQSIDDEDILDFIFQRVPNLKEWNDLSEAQKEKNNGYFDQNKQRITSSEQWNILQKYH